MKYEIYMKICINNIQNKIDKQNDKKDRISGDIICPLINYNNNMSTPRKQKAISPTRWSGKHIPVDPQKRQYMCNVHKNVQLNK